MGLFSKRKKKQENTQFEIPEIPHEHVWKDMPWYMEVGYSGSDKTASYQIVEPYICILCGERQNKILEKESWTHIDVESREKEYSVVRKRYRKYLRPRAVVEDMINNILLVKDPDYLDTVELMRGTPHRRCGTSAEMKRVEPKENDIGELVIPKENNR